MFSLMVSEFDIIFGMEFHTLNLLKIHLCFGIFYGCIDPFGIYFGLTFTFSQWLSSYCSSINQIYFPHTGNFTFNI